VSNKTIDEDLNVPHITDEIKKQANRYRNQITDHENQLIDDLLNPHTKRKETEEKLARRLNKLNG
jgi:hypothetical protein